VEDPPEVFVNATDPEYLEETRPATGTDTFVSVAFSKLSCAELWDKDIKGDEKRYKNVCVAAAKAGSIPVGP
jgi:hypothetical protein